MSDYAINGVTLDNTQYGWSLLRRSQPLISVSKNLTSIQVPGRNGVVTGVPSFKDAPTSTLVIRTPLTGLEALYSLFLRNGGSGYMTLVNVDPNIIEQQPRRALFEVASIEPEGINANDELVNVSVTLRFPTADWRATDVTDTGTFTATGGVSTVTILNNISSEIFDGDFFITGDFGNFSLKDLGTGSYVKTVKNFPYSAGTGLYYAGSTGQAFRASVNNPWTPLVDFSDYVDVSGGGGFRISPTWTNDPSVRAAMLELTVTNSSGVQYRVRARNAFAMRNGSI